MKETTENAQEIEKHS